MFVECLGQLPDFLPDFAFAPVVADRQAWEAIPAAYRARLVAGGEAALEQEWPLITACAFMEYHRNGNRTRFEDLFFARRRMLNALVMAEAVEGQGRFLDQIIDGVMLLCEESGWQLPAHNSYVRGGPRLALPDNSAPIIDLFAAETAAQLAVLASLLEQPLNAISPEIVRRIDRELQNRIIAPYLSSHFWWMGNGDEPMNNWTAWCTQNVLLTAFTRPNTQEDRGRIVEKSAKSLDAFLKDYGDDGACEEGAMYYRHAGLCLFNALNVLSSVAPAAFSPLWQQPKLRNMAEYIVDVHIDGQSYFNFADCSAVADRCSAREYLFGVATGSNRLADFAASDWAQDMHPELPQEINLFYRLQTAFAAKAMLARSPPAVEKPDIYYPSVGLLIARDETYALAVKAGDNVDSHNHNDVGSFTLYKNGKPFLIDVGVESYTAKTFSPSRYEIWTMQSAFHNLPGFAGVMQQDGETFAARDVQVELGALQSYISMDIAGAYPEQAHLRQYLRRVRLLKGHGVEIDDVFDGDKPAQLSLMFSQRPELSADGLHLPGLGNITVHGHASAVVEEIPITDPRLRMAWPDRLYRVLLPFKSNRLTLTVV
ncbi:heparinase II/III domain-containing protein [Rhizobium oryziradicis]|uniref:Heparinase n=1 Tax=Rhizobium oryziradicis TaxID=1867956 RepID=A0A1Q8ZXG5_9HYPH|nr:heparinase II/III family protein [Rhizobium oryziradicis]OLP46758.1 heparinase [Rhizobium oryziradicis]